MKKLIKNILALFFGLAISMVLAEIVLRIYNPLPSRFRGDKIQLKTNLKKKIVIEPRIAGLDSIITYSVNSLGFRGDEKPKNFNDVFSIITVGGSTTECSLLSDEKTWPFLLGNKLKSIQKNSWVNNAGLDGCSTYGNNILLDDYLLKLKPKMILFLVGINDKGKADFSNEDGFLIERKESFTTKLIKRSELANLLNNLYLAYKTQKVNIGHDVENPKEMAEIKITEEEKIARVKKYSAFLPSYKVRLQLLVKKCIDNNIIPVLLTQALLDNGLRFEEMELYNKTTKEVCAENKILCIDLANELPKDGNYFYDNMHYTNEGAEKVSEIIFNHLNNEKQTPL